jgi:hypothetical protein
MALTVCSIRYIHGVGWSDVVALQACLSWRQPGGKCFQCISTCRRKRNESKHHLNNIMKGDLNCDTFGVFPGTTSKASMLCRTVIIFYVYFDLTSTSLSKNNTVCLRIPQPRHTNPE